MRLFTYVMFTFFIAATLFFFGETTVMNKMFNNVAGGENCAGDYQAVDLSSGASVNNATNVMNYGKPSSCYKANDVLIYMVLVVVAASFGGWFLGFGITYVIPIAILFGFLNFMVFPIGSLFDSQSAMPDSIRIIILIFFNLITIMAVISYTNKGGV